MRSLILVYHHLGAKVESCAERLVRFLGKITEPLLARAAVAISVGLIALGLVSLEDGPLSVLVAIGAYMAASLRRARS